MEKIKEKKHVQKEAIIFFASYKFFRKINQKNNKLLMCSNNHFNLIFNEFLYQIYFKTYKNIYIEIDPIFWKLDEILECIKESQNKKSNIYLISTSAQKFFELKNLLSSKNIKIEYWSEEDIDVKESSLPHPFGKKII